MNEPKLELERCKYGKYVSDHYAAIYMIIRLDVVNQYHQRHCSSYLSSKSSLRVDNRRIRLVMRLCQEKVHMAQLLRYTVNTVSNHRLA